VSDLFVMVGVIVFTVTVVCGAAVLMIVSWALIAKCLDALQRRGLI
jgi:hypothetical protein